MRPEQSTVRSRLRVQTCAAMACTGLHCLSDQTIQPYAKQVSSIRFRNGHFARDAGTHFAEQRRSGLTVDLLRDSTGTPHTPHCPDCHGPVCSVDASPSNARDALILHRLTACSRTVASGLVPYRGIRSVPDARMLTALARSLHAAVRPLDHRPALPPMLMTPSSILRWTSLPHAAVEPNRLRSAPSQFIALGSPYCSTAVHRDPHYIPTFGERLPGLTRFCRSTQLVALLITSVPDC
jgi:hypothetical protein